MGAISQQLELQAQHPISRDNSRSPWIVAIPSIVPYPAACLLDEVRASGLAFEGAAKVDECVGLAAGYGAEIQRRTQKRQSFSRAAEHCRPLGLVPSNVGRVGAEAEDDECLGEGSAAANTDRLPVSVRAGLVGQKEVAGQGVVDYAEDWLAASKLCN